ncbi:helix-hairpin-helix domain-containing protein [Salinibacterium sp. G-O1]|uniref:helix-hairpin-helix domain-containing protein n=1 Tax=Salinibacterium sp. G-O1 TaxID=3046208 RepID=UPI0024BB41B8|nr:helix-hairpin-helix domain-containing protein [Salinibacterium sp. G-O1]MDJ0335443.1 helix-hairpin-helix domain-containing protein [Salinibacterium sp. G-O1]
MDEIPEPRRARLRVTVGAVVVLVLVALGCAVLVAALGDHGSTSDVVRSTPSATPGASTGGAIFVHILGAVERPGLYSLSEGDRAIDAVAAAGGFLETADQRQLNLARFVVDGEQIVVPIVGEIPDAAPGSPGAASGGKVNINTADEAALDTLPQVGPAMAARIIAYRTANGRFTAIEDLMNVTGVGAKTFEGMRDLVTV